VTPREAGDLLEVGAAERVDRLRVVADAGQAATACRHEIAQDALQRARVLVLVAQHMVERALEFVGDGGMLGE